MYNGGKIIAGLLIFIALIAFPFYANMGKTTEQPAALTSAPEDPHIGGYQIGQMRAEHMKLLDKWRDEVVRDGQRYVEFDGDQYEKSLQIGCLSCHDKQSFCDKCHSYAGVKPYCWGCHFAEGEGQI